VSLFSELDGAELVVADEDLQLFFAWYGGAGVQILDGEGQVVDMFSISTAFDRKLTVREVRQVITRYRREMESEADS
jgi:hypothetical protein